MAQAAAVAVAAAMLVGHVRGGRVRVHRGWIGVAQGSAVGRAAREGALMLVLAHTVQAVHWVYVGQARGVLLVRRVSVTELQKGGFRRIRGIEVVRQETHRHRRFEGAFMSGAGKRGKPGRNPYSDPKRRK